MKFKGKKHLKTVVRKYFAYFPINLDGDVRWLEKVKVKGFYWLGGNGVWYWEPEKFVR